MAHPRSPNPFPFALLAILGGLLVAARGRAHWAGALVALAAGFRLDFAIYGAAAVLALLAVESRRARPVLACAAVAAGGTALVYLPFAIAAGPGDLYDVLVAKSLRERDYWTLSFPWSFDPPALALPALAVAAAGVLLRVRRERRVPALWAGTAVLGLGMVSYLLSRTDSVHAVPVVVVLAVLLPSVAAWALRERPPLGRPLAVAAVAALALLLVDSAGSRLSALLRPPDSSPVDVAVADGVTAPPATARSIEGAVALVRARVPRGGAFYVAPARADLVPLTDPLLYVLADRDNATDRDVDLISRAPVQRRLLAQLERARPPVVVRWKVPLRQEREDNLQGRSSGVRLLDAWLARNYRTLRRLPDHDVLVPKQ